MSTKEMAYYILDHLSEEQLEGFVALFKRYFPTLEVQPDKQSDLQKSREAFEQLQKM